MTSDSTLTPFTAIDGENIAIHDWPLPEVWEDQPIQGTVIIVHGLGEHAFRYAHVARMLNEQGWHVRAYDQYGHGESGGKRGALPNEMRLVSDLSDVVEETRRIMAPNERLVLIGHSMGGVVVGSYIRQVGAGAVDGVIFSSPAFDPGLKPFQKFLLSFMPRIFPNLRVDNGLLVNLLSRDPLVVQAYKSDPYVHRKICARLAKFIADEGAQIIAHASSWPVPTLLVYAGADGLVSPGGSRAFAQAAPMSVVQWRCFESMYHEIFNDPQREQVFEALRQWLENINSSQGLAGRIDAQISS
jgi:alpha-beta hydrolase superfamily lysophospholipase